MHLKPLCRSALLAFLATFCTPLFATQSLDPAYKAAIVIDLNRNEVLLQERAHERHDPASLVKMMVLLIALEGAERGEVNLQAPCVVSANAERIGGHQVFLRRGEVFRLEELLKAVAIGSANDAAYAVAEQIAGSPDAFVQRMNRRAQELGMNETLFANVHGLPPDLRKGQHANYSTAYDLSILARELMKHPLAQKWASTKRDTFRNGTLQLVNTNHSFLQRFNGANGFKTGYHPRGAGFSVVATALRDKQQLLAVVLGAQSSRDRLRATSRLLDLGFSGKLRTAGYSSS